MVIIDKDISTIVADTKMLPDIFALGVVMQKIIKGSYFSMSHSFYRYLAYICNQQYILEIAGL